MNWGCSRHLTDTRISVHGSPPGGIGERRVKKLSDGVDEMHSINGMTLPQGLIEALESGEWKRNEPNLSKIFPATLLSMPLLYSFSGMQQENERWPTGDVVFHVGETDRNSTPGTIDPRRSVLIGDLQPELLIALDYRDSASSPAVLFQDMQGYWHKVAPTFDEFWNRLTSN
jgi:hypothetical protein